MTSGHPSAASANTGDVADPAEPLPDASFFAAPTPWEREGVAGEWFAPTELARGPWSPTALHGGPPTAVLARALERTFPSIRLARITVDLLRPVPMAGFGIVAEVVRPGRLIAATRAVLRADDGTVCAIAAGTHVATSEATIAAAARDNTGIDWPSLADATPGHFPIRRLTTGPIGFNHGVRMRYPIGETDQPGATAAWMTTVPIIAGEAPTPFQRACPVSDCVNAFSRHEEFGPGSTSFINPDLTVALHRDPVGDWIGLRASSQWQPHGVGLAVAHLFDDSGPVGVAMQMLLLRPI